MMHVHKLTMANIIIEPMTRFSTAIYKVNTRYSCVNLGDVEHGNCTAVAEGEQENYVLLVGVRVAGACEPVPKELLGLHEGVEWK